MTPVRCADCSTEYERNVIKECPSCSSTFWQAVKDKESVTISVPQMKVSNLKTEKSDSKSIDLSSRNEMSDLIEAQNRTTYAVRAFVRFLFIQLSGITAAVVVWNISLTFIDQRQCLNYGRGCEGNAFLQFVAILILLISIFFGSKIGWEELQKSEVPSR